MCHQGGGALNGTVTPPTLRLGVLFIYFFFFLNPGTKRAEFFLKTDHFPGLKPYIKFPTLKTSNKEPNTQRLPAGVHSSTGHPPGASQSTQFNAKAKEQ